MLFTLRLVGGLLTSMSLAFLIIVGLNSTFDSLLLLSDESFRSSKPIVRDIHRSAVVQAFGEPDRVIEIKGDPAGIKEVLVYTFSPDFSVYINEQDKVVTTRYGIASTLWRLDAIALFNMVFLLGAAITLTCGTMSPVSKPKGLGYLVYSLLLVNVQLYAASYLPLSNWTLGIAVLILPTIMLYVLGMAKLIWTWRRQD